MEYYNELIASRVFNAPRQTVWDAWTTPDIVKKWWGPEGFTAPVIKIDLREGGKYLYCMRGKPSPDLPEAEFWSSGKFIEINEPEKLVTNDYFSNDKGEKMDPVDYGMDPNFPKESTVTVNFDEISENTTKLSIVYKFPDSPLVRKAILENKMREGWSSSLDKLAELL